MLKDRSFRRSLIVWCSFAAIFTVAVLSFVSETAFRRVSEQYVEPDYIRYISQGFDLEPVSKKISWLITVTYRGEPQRIHVITADKDKNTLDVLEIPPQSYLRTDEFSGTAAEAFGREDYPEIIGEALKLDLSGSAAFECSALGGCAELLEITEGENAALCTCDGECYTDGRDRAVMAYRLLLSRIFDGLCKRGAYQSFTLLMNLIANEVDTDMPIAAIISAADDCRGIRTSKMNIRLAKGYIAELNGRRVWIINREGLAEQLNGFFRVKGEEVKPEDLGFPDLGGREDVYVDLPERVTDILSNKKEE